MCAICAEAVNDNCAKTAYEARDLACQRPTLESFDGRRDDMQRRAATALRLNFGEMPFRRRLSLATQSGVLRGPEKYRILDLKRRRAQIRARRELGLI